MSSLRITCQSCGQVWTFAGTYSLYRQQVVESQPCPRCEAYTLCCRQPDEPSILPYRPGRGLRRPRFLLPRRKAG